MNRSALWRHCRGRAAVEKWRVFPLTDTAGREWIPGLRAVIEEQRAARGGAVEGAVEMRGKVEAGRVVELLF